jgi:hypothetical protein
MNYFPRHAASNLRQSLEVSSVVAVMRLGRRDRASRHFDERLAATLARDPVGARGEISRAVRDAGLLRHYLDEVND